MGRAALPYVLPELEQLGPGGRSKVVVALAPVAERMGFDLDSRRGARVYRTERRQAWLLRALLGGEAYRKLLWETERL